MKIILIDHREGEEEPFFFLKPDSALQKNNKPFFIPDLTHSLTASMHAVIRVSKLGKNIGERFARRYYDGITVGLDLTAADIKAQHRASGLPWEMSNCFDGSAVIGDFLPLSMFETATVKDIRFDVEGVAQQQGETSDILSTADRLVAWTSRFFTMKTGDLIYMGPAGTTEVHIGDRLQGFAGERKLFDFHIR
jgi:fumarylpyruvate hydrolase